MKIISSILLIGITFFWGSPLKVLEATSQEWAGGTFESGYGTNYKITMKARGGSDKLSVHDLWVGEDYFEVKAVKDPTRRHDFNFEKRDSIYVFAKVTFKPDKEGQYAKEFNADKPCPIEFNGAALLGYTWKGKQKYLKIEEFEKLEKLIYP